MRGWSSLLAGFLLLGLAYWLYSLEGMGSEALVCGVASAAFLLRGAFGREVGGADGASGLLDFIHDPADAIVDSATDKLADWFGDDQAKETRASEPATPAAVKPVQPILVEPAKPVAPGAMDRYFAQREAEAAAAASAPAPVRGFGRKGL